MDRFVLKMKRRSVGTCNMPRMYLQWLFSARLVPITRNVVVETGGRMANVGEKMPLRTKPNPT